MSDRQVARTDASQRGDRHQTSVISTAPSTTTEEAKQQRLAQLRAERAMFDTVTVGTGRKPLPKTAPPAPMQAPAASSLQLERAPVYRFQLAEVFESDVPCMREPSGVVEKALRTTIDKSHTGRRVVPLGMLDGPLVAPTPDIESGAARHGGGQLTIPGTTGDDVDGDELLMLSIQQATSRKPTQAALDTIAPNDELEIARLHSGDDAISYFSTHGSSSAVKFVYCNHHIQERNFRPYDLQIVRRNEREADHFVISSSGVVHSRPGQPSEVIALSDWIRESALFNVLRKVRFFRTYLIYKAFVQWRKNIRQKLFLDTRRSLCKRFFLSKATFAGPTMDLMKAAYDLTVSPLFHYEPQGRSDYTIEEFNMRQSEVRSRCSQDFTNTLEKIESRLTKLTDAIQSRANVPDLTTMESLEQYLLAHSTASAKDRKGGKKMKSMLDAKQEQNERMRELKRSMVEYSMLDAYIRLIDYATAENIFRNGLLTVVRFYETVRDASPDDEVKKVRFQVLIQASEDAMKFKPGEADIAKTYTDLVEDIVQTINISDRLITRKPLKIFFAKNAKYWSIGAEFKRDARILATKRLTYDLIKSDFVDAQEKMKNYDSNRQWIYFIEVQWPEIRRKWAATSNELKSEEIGSVYKRLAAAQDSFGRLYTEYVGHLLFINAQRLKADLQPKLDKIQSEVNETLKLTVVARIKTLEAYFNASNKKIHLDPRDPNPKMSLPNFFQFLSSLRDIQADEAKTELDIEEAESLYSMLFEQKVPDVKDDDRALKERALGGMNQNTVSETSTREKFNTAKLHADSFVQANLPNMLAQLETEMVNLNNKCSEYIEALDGPDLTTVVGLLDRKLHDTPEAYSSFETLGEMEGMVKGVKDQADTLSRYYKLFTGKDPSAWRELDHLTALYNARRDLWNLLRNIEETCHRWFTVPVDKLEGSEVETTVRDFHKKSVQLAKIMKEGSGGIGFKDSVGAELAKVIDDIRGKVPVMQDCANRHLTAAHWNKVLSQIPNAPTWNVDLCLRDLDWGSGEEGGDIFAHREKIEQAAATATGEYNLQNALLDIKKVWDVVEFSCRKYKEGRDVYILDKLDEVIQQLDDHHVNLQTILASRHIGAVRPRVEEWVIKLRTVSDVIEEWITMQKNWMYLEFIFCAEDIRKQLPEESERFDQVDKFFKSFTNKAQTVKNVLLISTDEVLTQLKSYNKAIDEIQKKLEDYLELKRSAFPRFYFLSNDELLAILSDVQNPRAVEPHLPKCFDAIYGLSFAQTEGVSNKAEIIGMKSGEGEVVNFHQPVVPVGNVEFWLRNIEATMRSTLWTSTRDAFEAYTRRPREQWFFEHPAQSVQAVDMIYWTSEVEQAIADNTIASYHKRYQSQLLNIVKLVQGPLSKLQRTLVCTLIVVDVHNRDIVAKLVQANVRDVQDFEWMQQLRYYWETDASMGTPDAPLKNCGIHHCNAHLWYGYEYLGNQARLVITPLTDRAFLTCTGALAMNLGAAPQGPAGTGKTESVKDLGKALARQVVVFNCSDGINYKTMSRMFAGLAQAGAWACFDEFNRIELEVLSVIAQQMLEIVTALGQKVERLDFDGRRITLSKNFGVFITMNPGYAGRTELPDNLKALFRPICMMIPDYALIAEIMFYSEGFADARTLAQKMVQLYKLSSEQLSKQKHYDFGMRAVKSILVMAGGLKRSNPTENEDMLLIRAMRDSNVPKFLRDDTVLFMALIRDLFPTVDIRDVPNQQLINYIEKDLAANSLQVVPGFVLKAVQLFDTLVVRHGVMMVGATMCAKTTIIETVQRSLTKLKMDNADPQGQIPLYNVVKTHVLNPKAVTMGELYGEVNPFTREWTDGLLSGIARGVKDESDKKNQARQWIVFDGPVDAVWIENMNTVLDDNKMLCLFNGERIKLPATATFMFEVQDLKVASPATVSRCGMVFVEPFYLDGGWRPVAKSLIAVLGHQLGAKFRTARILDLFEKLVPETLTFLRGHCKEYVPSADAQLVVSCLHLLHGMIVTGERPAVVEAADESAEASDPLLAEFRRPALPTKVAAQDPNALFDLYFVMSFIWSLGGNVADVDRTKFSDFLKPKLEALFPAVPKDKDVSIYSFAVHKPSMGFVPWTSLVPDFSYNRQLPYFELFVATAETTSVKSIMHSLVSVGRNILLNGVTGVGKSAVIMDFITNTLKADSPSEPYEYFTTCFSAQTRASDLLERVEGKLNKIKAQLLGATPGKKAIFFIDDVNMPALEKYGASPPIEVLRQLMSQKGFYDLKKKPALFKEIQDLLFIAACGVPGGGRNELSMRLTSRHHMLCQPSVPTSSMRRIFTLILGGFLSIWSMDVRRLASKLVDATKACYDRISAEKLPTPAKSHYTFNLRDFGKVIQGLLQANPATITDTDGFIRLFVHEVSRVFHDRLADDQDRQWWWQTVGEVCSKTFDLTWSNAYESILFADFMRGEDNRVYEEVLDMHHFQDKLMDRQMSYNLENNKSEELVFFNDAAYHIARICRICRQPRGNALLVGVGGSGRQSLTRLAAFICGMPLYQIAISRSYGINEFREDIKEALLESGCENKPVVFLLSDSQIVKEQFLEDINNILNTGEVPNLMQQEDNDKIIEAMRKFVKAAGKQETRGVLLAQFTLQCRDNFHIVLTMSPVGENLRRRLRMFPSLVNCTTIDWFSKWPADALNIVALRVLNKLPLDDGVKQSLAKMCVRIHEDVQTSSVAYFEELRRHNYTTPTSYLELLSSYQKMLEEQSNMLIAAVKRLQGGLDKLQSTQVMVDDMKASLTKMKPVLESAAKDTERMMIEVDQQQKEAEVIRQSSSAEEQAAAILQAEADGVDAKCQAELDKAQPMLDAATAALDTINSSHIQEIRALKQPPERVTIPVEAVMVLLGIKDMSWNNLKLVMAKSTFISDLKTFKRDEITDKSIRQLRKNYTQNPEVEFTVENFVKGSECCGSLAKWVLAIDNYFDVNKIINPLREQKAQAQEKLAGANEKLRGARQQLQSVENRVAQLRRAMQETIEKKKQLEEEMKLTELRLMRAGKLMSGLASEQIRWTASVSRLKQEQIDLVGTILLAAGCVAYLGPFTAPFRARMVATWADLCRDLKIPVSGSGFSLASVADPVKVRQWNQKGLPSDAFSVENGVIVSRSQRWCLCIDPQGQANAWIRAMERDNNLKIIKLTEPNYMRTLENAIKIGLPVLLENVEESIDASIDPLLLRQWRKADGGRLLLRLGDSEIDYDPAFRFYITTKLPNPHYMPELQIKVTIINFTVTPKGLEDQLLADVVRFERADLEQRADKTVVEIAEGKQQLKDIEDRILQLLASSGSNILDNEDLINTLADAKKTSESVAHNLQVAEATQRDILSARDKYRPVATRGSLIYSVIAEVGGLEHMYQYSLDFFKKLFMQTLKRTEPSEDVLKRVATLLPAVTQDSYNTVCRGLFERDKQLFAFMLVGHIFRDSGEISEEEWGFFCRGGEGLGVLHDGESWPEQIPETTWREVAALHRLSGFENIKNHIFGEEEEWLKWIASDTAYSVFPASAADYSPWRKLLILRIFREDLLVYGMNGVIGHYLGKLFTESPAFDLDAAFEDSSPTAPIIFVLTAGTDPTATFTEFADKKGFADRKHMLSLGQDQGPKAQEMINVASKTGQWVYLQNCHVYASWMPNLERALEDLMLRDVNRDFRLWLTTMPTSSFPVLVLQSGIKVTKEPPRGLKANLRDSFLLAVTPELWESSKNPNAWKRLLFSLAYFHAVVQERRKFGALGWNIPYEWNQSDFTASIKTLASYLADYDDVPWTALRYITGMINYGGRVTDFLDQRCLQTILSRFFDNVVVNGRFNITSDGVYCIPDDISDIQTVKKYLSDLPPFETPELFGLHSNADITYNRNASKRAVDALVTLQPRAKGGGASNTDDKVFADCARMLDNLPPLIDKATAHEDTYRITEAGTMVSLGTVASQEIDVFNFINERLRKWLKELLKAIRGEVVMSQQLEGMYNAIAVGRVPESWHEDSYLSLKPLASWFQDTLRRIDFLRDWNDNGPPMSFWISGFYFPQGFLTGVLQTHSRAHKIPVDDIKFRTHVMQLASGDEVEDTPESGVYIHGLYLEGARLDKRQLALTESMPGELYTPMHVIWLEPVLRAETTSTSTTYACPMYKTSARAGALSTTGLSTNFVLSLDLNAGEKPPSHWILRGAALLCMLDT